MWSECFSMSVSMVCMRRQKIFHWIAQLHTPKLTTIGIYWSAYAVHAKIYYFWRPTDIKMNVE